MASLLPTVSFAPLVPGYTSIDQKTIEIIAQLTIGSGVYETGGIPAGVATLAGSLTIDSGTFLTSCVESEDAVPSTGTSYLYKYIPAFDYLQIFVVTTSSGTITSTVELGSSVIIPAGVLADTIVGVFRYNRLGA